MERLEKEIKMNIALLRACAAFVEATKGYSGHHVAEGKAVIAMVPAIVARIEGLLEKY